MRITAFSLGSYGDVMPFIILGKELIKRGYDYNVATYENFKDKVIGEGVGYKKISGDAEEMVAVLLGNSNNGASEGMNGISYLLNKYPKAYEDFYAACKESDLVIYMQFGAPAYHFAEKMGIPAIRSLVFPFEKTKKYCAISETMRRDSLKCLFKNLMCKYFMIWAARGVMNEWRKRLGLKKQGLFSDYTKINGKRLLTLYQYDEVLARRDKKWKSNIKLTGNWIEVKYNADKNELAEIEEFCKGEEKVVYVGFGSMNYSKLDELYLRVLGVILKKTKAKVVLPNGIREKAYRQYGKDKERMAFIGFMPFEQLFPLVDVIIHHGGNGTVHAALRNKKPQLVMAFGADQMFWGGQCYYLNIGPAPINVKKPMKQEILEKRITDLVTSKIYEENSKKLSKKVSINGVKKAADIIERKYPLDK